MRFHTAVNKFCLNAVLKENIPVWGNAMELYRPYLSLKRCCKKQYFFSLIKKNLTIKFTM